MLLLSIRNLCLLEQVAACSFTCCYLMVTFAWQLVARLQSRAQTWVRRDQLNHLSTWITSSIKVQFAHSSYVAVASFGRSVGRSARYKKEEAKEREKKDGKRKRLPGLSCNIITEVYSHIKCTNKATWCLLLSIIYLRYLLNEEGSARCLSSVSLGSLFISNYLSIYLSTYLSIHLSI